MTRPASPKKQTNIRVVDKSTGRPKIIGLEFSKLRHQDASTTRDAMFSTLQKHGVSKAVAEKKMVSVSVDGASVNMGGLKALIQNNPGMSGVIQILRMVVSSVYPLC